MSKYPYNPAEELKAVGEYKLFNYDCSGIEGAIPFPKYNYPITPRENARLLLAGEEPAWMPIKDDFINFCPIDFPDNVARAEVFEAASLAPEAKGGKDWFGIE